MNPMLSLLARSLCVATCMAVGPFTAGPAPAGVDMATTQLEMMKGLDTYSNLISDDNLNGWGQEGDGLKAKGVLGAADDVRARPGRLSAISFSHSKLGLHGAFVRARRAPNNQTRRFPARAGSGDLA
jgi:hypothetical protein